MALVYSSNFTYLINYLVHKNAKSHATLEERGRMCKADFHVNICNCQFF